MADGLFNAALHRTSHRADILGNGFAASLAALMYVRFQESAPSAPSEDDTPSPPRPETVQPTPPPRPEAVQPKPSPRPENDKPTTPRAETVQPQTPAPSEDDKPDPDPVESATAALIANLTTASSGET